MPTRNVINVSDVELFVEDFAQRTDHPALKRWLSSNVRRWILKHYDLADRVVLDPASGSFALTDKRVTRRPFGGAAPDWSEAAIARGDEVVHLRLGATLYKRVNRALAALAAELEDGTLASPDRIPFPKAEAKAKSHRRRTHSQLKKERVERGTVPVFQTASGETVVVLTAPESLADEGSRMAHCVGTYDRWVERGECKIFSLRDRNGKPRATIETDGGGCVWQIKGFADGAVDPCYRPALQNFIRTHRYVVEDDQDNIVTVRKLLRRDPAKTNKVLVDRDGLELLHNNRYCGYGAMFDNHLDLSLRTIAANADHMPDSAHEAVFAALRPDDDVYIRTRRMARFSVYGIGVSLTYVEVPLPLIYLVRQRAFKSRGGARDAIAICRATESALIRLTLAAPNQLYALGPACSGEPWEVNLMECPADVLKRSQVDIKPLRRVRHVTLRQAMNKARQQHVEYRKHPGVAHKTVRELLDGWRGLYVL